MSRVKKVDRSERKELENQEYKDLMLLQHNVKVQPELYTKDTIKAVGVFKEEYNKVKTNPAVKNDRFIHYCSLLAHICDIFKKDLAFIPNFLFELLLTYGAVMNPYNRLKIVKCIILMRNKGFIEPVESLNFFFKLLTIKDKEMRTTMIQHIINDIKGLNIHRKCPAVNKKVQNYIFETLKTNSDTLAKRAIFIMIELYKKQVWNDSKTVNVIASGCFNENQKVVLLASRFLIETTEQTYDVDSDSDEEEAQAKEIKFTKKTKSKEARKEREMKKLKRRERRKSKVQLMKNFFPIDMINNPQDFCDRLFAQLKKKNFKFEVTLSQMAVLGRMISRHNLLVINFHPFMMKYLFPHQKEIAKILAYVAESCHDMVPPDEMQAVIKHIIDNFINERVNDDKISMGLRTMREMCEKAPFIMDEFSLNYCAEFKDFKEKNVAAAARSLINFYKDVNPDLLNKKFRGRFDTLDKKEDRKPSKFGEMKVVERVEGANLLKEDGDGLPVEWDRIMTDEDFKKIKILKKRKMEEAIEKRDNLNQFDRSEKSDGGNEDLEDLEGVSGDEDDDEEGEEGDEGDEDEEDGSVINISDLDSDDELEIIEGEEGEDDDDKGEDGDGDAGEEGNKTGEWEDVDGTEKEKKKSKSKSKEKKSNKSSSKGDKSKIEDIEIEEEDPDKIEQWQLDEYESSDEENPHGFVNPDNISRFRKSKKARKLDEKDAKVGQTKEKWYKGPKQKTGGTTNEEKNKNKPLFMLRPKKNRIKDELLDLKRSIKNVKQQLGHVRSKKQAVRKRQAKFKNLLKTR